jgi:hypothetical protein
MMYWLEQTDLEDLSTTTFPTTSPEALQQRARLFRAVSCGHGKGCDIDLLLRLARLNGPSRPVG